MPQAGRIIALGVAGLLAACLGAVIWRAGGLDWPAGAGGALRFTLGQAAASAVLSVLPAIPLARALARRRFAGRGVLVTLLGAPFLLPVIVAVLGLIAVFGRSGLINSGLAMVGLPPVDIYGLQGVVLAHVFFNLPFATRLILQGWAGVPVEQMRLASSLGFTPAQAWRHIEAPMLARVLPGAALMIFLICTTSFAVALILGGGPRATTLELAIYQAFRFDFDLPAASSLALVQVAVCSAALLGLSLLPPAPQAGRSLRRAAGWPLPRPRGTGVQDAAIIAGASLFLLTPMIVLLIGGAAHVATLPAPIWAAAARSTAVALAAAALCVALALSMARAASRSGLVALAGTLPVAISPLVIGVGAFILIVPHANPSDLALPVTAVANALLSLPFAIHLLIPAIRDLDRAEGRLAASLGLTGWARLRRVDLPRLAAPLGFAAGLAAAFSMGDLGVIALFGAPGGDTLPLVVSRLMGAYRMGQAEGAAIVLLALTLGVFALFDLGGRYAASR